MAVDVLGGIASGLFASWVMERAQVHLSKLGGQRVLEREKAATSSDAPATAKAAQAVVRPFGVSLTDEQKRTGGELVHYAYGAGWGAVYGLLSRDVRLEPVVKGALFGALLWLVSDELLVPLFGLSKRPDRYPASVHLKGLAAHVVYGAAAGEAQGLLRARFG